MMLKNYYVSWYPLPIHINMNGRSIFKSYDTYLSCIFSFPWGLSFSVRSISIGVRAFIQIRITFSKGCNSRGIRNKIAETRINICTSYVWIILSIFRILKRDKIFTHFYDIFDQHKCIHIKWDKIYSFYMIFVVHICTHGKKPAIQSLTRYASSTTLVCSSIVKSGLAWSFNLYSNTKGIMNIAEYFWIALDRFWAIEIHFAVPD